MNRKYIPSRARKRNKASLAQRKVWLNKKGGDTLEKPIEIAIKKNPVNKQIKVLNDQRFYYDLADLVSFENSSKDSEEVNIEDLWDSKEEYESIMNHKLTIEIEKDSFPKVINGHRIVNLNYVLSWALYLQSCHSKICTTGRIFPIGENLNGLVSTITFGCNLCSKQYTYSTEEPELELSAINVGAVWGTLSSGSGFAQLDEFCAIMNITPMSYYKFSQIENTLGEAWQDTLAESMKNVGKEEKRLAIEEGRLEDDGVPFIKVVVDGGWSKRSYGHSYNAPSGVGVIIGQRTGKVLYYGVRNKYCTNCKIASNQRTVPKPHTCFKNWKGSSSAMEADIIVEGFNQSESMHGLRYLEFVGDGDSSVFARIREKVTYGKRVNKIECKNHTVKNYGKTLHKLKNDLSINVAGRKLLTFKLIANLQKIVQKVIAKNSLTKDIGKLKNDLMNGPNHVFGNHIKCRDVYCEEVGNTTKDITIKMKDYGIFDHITGALEGVLRKAGRLVDNDTSNAAETFMSIVARSIGGKRVNYSLKGSYSRRIGVSGLRYNSGPSWSYSAWKEMHQKSPGKNLKIYLEKVSKRRTKSVKRRLSFSQEENDNIDYGPKAIDVPLSPEEYEEAAKRILMKFQKTKEEINTVSAITIGQFDNPRYKMEKTDRLTASNFGTIIKRKDTTPCHNHVKLILYPKYFETAGTNFGKMKEKVAIKRFEEKYKMNVKESGLFIDEDHGYLAASPDGLIGEKDLVEVKCLFGVFKKKISLRVAAERDKTLCLEIKNGDLQLKRTHSYYYQVQGQLNISKRERCYFIVYIGDDFDIHVEEIPKDEVFWREKMLPKLLYFYKECVLKELINGQIRKGLRCEEPA